MKDEALKLALEALEKSIAITMANIDLRNKAITAIRQALAASVQEPALAIYQGEIASSNLPKGFTGMLYTTPPTQPAPVQEQTDWEAVAADQAMTISMMKVDQEKSKSAYQRGYMDGMAKQRPWIGLTDAEAEKLRIEKEFDRWNISAGVFKYAVRDIEAKLKELNR